MGEIIVVFGYEQIDGNGAMCHCRILPVKEENEDRTTYIWVQEEMTNKKNEGEVQMKTGSLAHPFPTLIFGTETGTNPRIKVKENKGY
ncbi:hypothetical protein V6N12_058326 [Hibiscus sabdariffa]|uniref:Uncharacterized protein n=1 Tax=Hibiscus sabdariffa TaxID=183260 RepID=A0ABR2ERT4_9ROSI